MMTSQIKLKASVNLSKTKYMNLKMELSKEFDSEITEKVLSTLCKVLQCDPSLSTYDSDAADSIRMYRARKKEQGISTYVSSGMKNMYEKQRENRIACTNYLCESHGYEKYKGYCIRCFVHMFPDEPVTRGFKTKESTVVQWIKEKYPDKRWIFDRKVDNGCSRFRPDIFLDLLTHSLIIEIDENQHESYENMCENKRMMSLFEDLGNRPLVLIRFNPDSYTNLHGTDVKSCFVYTNQNGLPSIRDPKKWNERLETLKNCIDHHINTVPEKEITVEHLYYDGYI